MTPLPGQAAPDFDFSQFGFNPYQTGLMKQYAQAMGMRRMMSAMRGGLPRRQDETFQQPAPLPPMNNPGMYGAGNSQVSAQPGMYPHMAPDIGFGQGPGGFAPGSFQQSFAPPQQQQQTYTPPPPNAAGGTYYSGPAYGYQGSRTQHPGARRSSQFFY